MREGWHKQHMRYRVQRNMPDMFSCNMPFGSMRCMAIAADILIQAMAQCMSQGMW